MPGLRIDDIALKVLDEEEFPLIPDSPTARGKLSAITVQIDDDSDNMPEEKIPLSPSEEKPFLMTPSATSVHQEQELDELISHERRYKSYMDDCESMAGDYAKFCRIMENADNIQRAMTILDSKITSSFCRFNMSQVALVLINVVTIAYTCWFVAEEVTDDSDNFMPKYLEGVLLAALMLSFLLYKLQIHSNRKNGISSTYEAVKPLSEEEVSPIQDALAVIEYKGNAIGTTATGDDIRSAVKALIPENTKIKPAKQYIAYIKKSIFEALPNEHNIKHIPGVPEIITDYCIDDPSKMSAKQRKLF